MGCANCEEIDVICFYLCFRYLEELAFGRFSDYWLSEVVCWGRKVWGGDVFFRFST